MIRKDLPKSAFGRTALNSTQKLFVVHEDLLYVFWGLNLEGGKNASTVTLLEVCRTLRRTDWIVGIAPPEHRRYEQLLVTADELGLGYAAQEQLFRRMVFNLHSSVENHAEAQRTRSREVISRFSSTILVTDGH